MDKIREWTFPVAMLVSWMSIAAYVLIQVASPAPMPTIEAPEVVITVGPANPS